MQLKHFTVFPVQFKDHPSAQISSFFITIRIVIILNLKKSYKDTVKVVCCCGFSVPHSGVGPMVDGFRVPIVHVLALCVDGFRVPIVQVLALWCMWGFQSR